MTEPVVTDAGAAGPDGDRARWNRRYWLKERSEPAKASTGPPDPPSALLRLASLLPTEGRAVDLAGGDGGGGLFLARRGLSTTVVDVSSVALARASVFAEADGAALEAVEVDLGGADLGAVLDAVAGPPPAIITCFNYLDRAILSSVGAHLPTGARFMVAIATTTNLECNRRPPERFLLEPGELGSLVGIDRSSLQVLHRREGWADGRHLAELVVRAR